MKNLTQPTKNGISPAVEERLRAFGIDPAQFSENVRLNARGTGMRDRKMQALTLAPTDVQNADLLSQSALMYENNNYIADEVAPVELVPNRTGKYFLYARGPGRSLIETRVGPQSVAKEVSADVTTDTYLVEDHALREPVPSLTDAANPELGLKTGAIARVTDLLLMMRESRVSTLMNATASYAAANVTALGATRKWNGGSAATPVADMLAAIEAVRGPVTHVVISDIVWHAIQQNAAISAILASQLYNQGLLRPMDFGLYFGIPNVMITKAEYEDSTGARKRLWSEANMVLLNVNPAREARTFMRTFRWRQGAGGFIATTWMDNSRGPSGTLMTKVTHSDMEKVVSNDYGAIITGVKQ